MNRVMLSEWHPQSAIQLAWPHAQTDWQPWLAEIEDFYIGLISQISQYQNVLIATPTIDSKVMARLQHAGANLDRVCWQQINTNDTWARDHGPIAVSVNNTTELMNFRFNAWGGKYQANLDDGINRAFANAGAYQFNLIDDPQELEGGGIETDGHGTLLCTDYWLSKRFESIEIAEAFFSRSLGMQKFLWLTTSNLAGDDTDAHIDTLARFLDAHTIAYVQCQDPQHPQCKMLASMEAQLQTFTDYQGVPYKLVPLPMPDTIVNQQGEPLPATYANFLITNRQVIVPTYNDRQDELALAAIRSHVTQREVVGMNCRTAIEQYGSLHCLTMQLPEGAI